MALKDHITRNKKFLKDNFVLFIGIFILNVLGYVFHFYVGRKLGPGDYGTFGSLLSIIYIIAMPLTAIQTSITKFVSTFKAENEDGKIAYLLTQSLRKMALFGVIIFIAFLALSPFLADFLRIDSLIPFFVLAFFLLFSLFIPIVRGVIQGLQQFKLLGISYITEGVFKLGTGVISVSLGFGVGGAIGGFVFSYFFAIILTAYFIMKYFRIKKEKFKGSDIYKYSFPVLIILVTLTGIYTLDLLLVKHFFDPVDAGFYAALSLLGKVIFFGTLSIGMVMFSKVAENYAANKEHRTLLYKSLLLVTGFGGGITVFYFLFPRFTISLLFGSEFFAMSSLLGLFGTFMTIFSLVYILAFYNASIHKTNFVYILILFNIVEIILITLFHDTLLQVVLMLLGLVILLFISLLFYTFLTHEKPIHNYSGI